MNLDDLKFELFLLLL